MTHTAELNTIITEQEYRELIEYEGGKWERGKNGRNSFHIRTLSQCGITDIKPRRITAGIVYYMCNVILNLRRLANNGERTHETYTDEAAFPSLSANFEKHISAILPTHATLETWNLCRIDYNIDLKMSPTDVEHYIVLLQRGDKSHSWKVHELIQDKERRQRTGHGQRKMSHPAGSVLYDNTQYSINIYDKHAERLHVQKERGIVDEQELQRCEGILRIEVQTKRKKLSAIKQKMKQTSDFEGKPLDAFARYDLAEYVIVSALRNICGETDYMSFKAAVRRIERSKARYEIQAASVDFLRLVTRTRSLWSAKEKYTGSVKLETVLKHLQKLNINPVTIPEAFKRDTMENLFHIVAAQFAEEKARGQIAPCSDCLR